MAGNIDKVSILEQTTDLALVTQFHQASTILLTILITDIKFLKYYLVNSVYQFK